MKSNKPKKYCYYCGESLILPEPTYHYSRKTGKKIRDKIYDWEGECPNDTFWEKLRGGHGGNYIGPE